MSADPFSQATLWTPEKDGKVRCHLCRHGCLISPGQKGRCAVRENKDGTLVSLVGSKMCSIAIDPVEKKPLNHYLPGSKTFSMGSMGCNFSCTFCQNDDLSDFSSRFREIQGQICSPEQICTAAVRYDCRSVAFTYNEPTIFYEFMTATADLALEKGLGTIMVSNGFQSPETLKGLEKRIQAANIDLKSFSEDFYRNRCGGRLAPVLDNLKRMVDMGWWIEVTTLFIPGLNDSVEEMHNIAKFIKNELSSYVPWHCSAFHPCYKMTDRPFTPEETLAQACVVGEEEGLAFVYPGNTILSKPTRCPSCGAVCIERRGWKTIPQHGFDGHCPQCKKPVPGMWR